MFDILYFTLLAQLKEDIERLGDNDKLLHKKQLLINMTNYFKFIKTLKVSKNFCK